MLTYDRMLVKGVATGLNWPANALRHGRLAAPVDGCRKALVRGQSVSHVLGDEQGRKAMDLRFFSGRVREAFGRRRVLAPDAKGANSIKAAVRRTLIVMDLYCSWAIDTGMRRLRIALLEALSQERQ